MDGEILSARIQLQSQWSQNTGIKLFIFIAFFCVDDDEEQNEMRIENRIERTEHQLTIKHNAQRMREREKRTQKDRRQLSERIFVAEHRLHVCDEKRLTILCAFF